MASIGPRPTYRKSWWQILQTGSDDAPGLSQSIVSHPGRTHELSSLLEKKSDGKRAVRSAQQADGQAMTCITLCFSLDRPNSQLI